MWRDGVPVEQIVEAVGTTRASVYSAISQYKDGRRDRVGVNSKPKIKRKLPVPARPDPLAGSAFPSNRALLMRGK